MKPVKKTMIVAIVLLSMVTFAEARIEITNTSDSYMRPYLETTFGNVPSAGHYTHWTVYVQSDKPEWVRIGFNFDNRKEIVLLYATPYTKRHIYANGYMKTFTNSVNVTVESPYDTSRWDSIQ